MKKFAIFVLAAILILSLTACGRTNKDMDRNDSTPSTSQPAVTDPTSATNIPDPTVNENSTDNNNSGNGAVGNAVEDMMPEGTDRQDATDTTENK